ncbi:MAG: hypothetical protein WCA10_18390 [Terracidiphilus sp.]
MRFSRLFAVPVLALVCLAGANSRAAAQISISIGVAPVCPYGFFNYAPYQCAPFGYYGPEWFSGGVFYGAGPWFRGPVGFHGYINHDYDPHFGYRGPFPARGEHADWGRHRGWEHQWHGNEYHNEVRHDNGNHNGHYQDHGNHAVSHGNPHNDSRGNGHNDNHGRDHDNKDHGHGHDK